MVHQEGTDMPGEPDRVVVRMYRGVLGDCFLIMTSGAAGVAMIDCGVLQNVQPGPDMVTGLPKAVVASVGKDALAKVEATKDAVLYPRPTSLLPPTRAASWTCW